MPRFRPHAYIRTYTDLLSVKGGWVVESFTNPYEAVANRLVTSTAMKVGTYTVANGGIATDNYAHPVTLARTLAGTSLDTPGTVTFTGTDNAGAVITDALVPGTSTTTVNGVKAFRTVTSIVGAGWIINSDGTPTADTIVCGFGPRIGLGQAATAAGDIQNVYNHADGATVASFTGTADGTVSGTFFTPTGVNHTLDYDVVYQPVPSTVLTAVTAATLATSPALGFEAVVEEFGFRINQVLAGAGGTATYTLCDRFANVIATLVLTLALGAAGQSIKTTTIIAAYKNLVDDSTLVVKRTATGTAFTSGSGTFYVKLAQRTQRA